MSAGCSMPNCLSVLSYPTESYFHKEPAKQEQTTHRPLVSLPLATGTVSN